MNYDPGKDPRPLCRYLVYLFLKTGSTKEYYLLYLLFRIFILMYLLSPFIIPHFFPSSLSFIVSVLFHNVKIYPTSWLTTYGLLFSGVLCHQLWYSQIKNGCLNTNWRQTDEVRTKLTHRHEVGKAPLPVYGPKDKSNTTLQSVGPL